MFVSVNRRHSEVRAHIAMWIQTYTEPVPLKHGKLAAKKIRGYADIFYGVRRMPYPEAIAPHARARGVNVAQRILNLKTY